MTLVLPVLGPLEALQLLAKFGVLKVKTTDREPNLNGITDTATPTPLPPMEHRDLTLENDRQLVAIVPWPSRQQHEK